MSRAREYVGINSSHPPRDTVFQPNMAAGFSRYITVVVL
jgi:hypothetical protein